ncbi:unnamed protein product [Protopolystoma xenopodis]|uniref:Uncharacterized protein n=1 Tax=Protopolystoma xenopodis TaxID=117903 RepID=A0A448XT26_9PLAT|nr:unnamed protein product [Protopolystoma xenopodis]
MALAEDRRAIRAGDVDAQLGIWPRMLDRLASMETENQPTSDDAGVRSPGRQGPFCRESECPKGAQLGNRTKCLA